MALRLVPPSGTPIEISRDTMLVGRDPASDVVIPDGSVSRKHARVERRGNDWYVVDQGSANGTFVDGQRVAEGRLLSGQEVRFGAMTYHVEAAGEEDSDSGATVVTSAPEVTMVQPVPVAPPRPGTPPRPAEPPRPAPPPPPGLRPPVPPTVESPGLKLPGAPGAPPGMPPPLGGSPAPPPPPRAPVPPPPPPPRVGMPGASPRAAGPPGGEVSAPPVGAPPRRGRGPVFWVLTGCCGCLLLGLVGIGLIGGVAFFATQDVVQTVRAQLGELKAGNVEAAYARMSDTYKQSHRAQDFGAFAARHPGLKDNADSTFLTRRIENDRGHLEGTLTATSGAKESVTYALIKQSDGWRIEDIKFESESAASAAGGGGDDGDSLEVETVDLKKEPQGEGVRVSMRIRVTGFSVRPDDDGGFRMDLAEDLETIGPDGEKIPDLSRMALETLQEKTAQESGNSAEFTNTLTFGRPAPGSYVVRVTIRDLAGKNLKTHAIPFDLP